MTTRINKVYTKAGDNGETTICDGVRVNKSHILIELIGALDELNAILGIVKVHLNDKTIRLKPEVDAVQQQLFFVGAQVAYSIGSCKKGNYKVDERDVKYLEGLCDFYNDELPGLDSFVVPGGSTVAAFLQLSRTVARRVERLAVRARADIGPSFNNIVVVYLNRLSDLLFIWARWCLKHEGVLENYWDTRTQE